MKKFLFLGDSVTDCSRKRSNKYGEKGDALGHGWVQKLNATLNAKYKDLTLYNRGFSGCLTQELSNQIDWWPVNKDTGEPVKMAISTIMIGINDVWHPFWKNKPHSIPRAIDAYSSLLNHAQRYSDHVILMEPIALPWGEVMQNWWPHIHELSDGQFALAGKNGCNWLALQNDLLKASNSKPEDYLSDGVHPTALGHHWLAKQWFRFVVEQKLIS